MWETYLASNQGVQIMIQPVTGVLSMELLIQVEGRNTVEGPDHRPTEGRWGEQGWPLGGRGPLCPGGQMGFVPVSSAGLAESYSPGGIDNRTLSLMLLEAGGPVECRWAISSGLADDCLLPVSSFTGRRETEEERQTDRMGGGKRSSLLSYPEDSNPITWENLSGHLI